ncbi:hypothetical protein BT96DRAFT_928553 [Gymnopus androsaceus JB14]|uniref:DUF6699 domain-containing protein n=1 Tax=Gymnopus androsaceus JB14 TaxID=1447944 RepID=A0A6A4GJQ4_9AGAR|nr:hypothetical protein BT96DRAFT_928553 [Gymnopus androsaceus JB14]
MPGKHVRFANISTAYSASAPSLSYSVPSVPSSFRPSNPTISLFMVLPSSHHAHSRPQPKRSHSYPLPTRSAITASHKGLSTASFSEPAVYPPVSSLVIQIPHHIWPISVYASYNGQYVTVNDVFTAVYHSLRTNVSSSEYRAIPSKKDAEKVRMAYEMRYRRIRDRYAYESEKQQGVKRVDFLNGHTRFTGLATSNHGSGAWVLHLS